MGLSGYLQDPAFLKPALDGGPARLRETVLARGTAWYREHPDEAAVIRGNLDRFGIDYDEDIVGRIIEGILLHYHEKLLPLCLGPSDYRAFLDDRVDGGEALRLAVDVRSRGAALLCAASHFGGVELIAPYLASRGIAVTGALRFATESFSAAARHHAARLQAEGGFAKVDFVEIGKPGVPAALAMAAVLRRGETLLSVFDEQTGYSKPCLLFGRKVSGGAGLDRILRLSNAPAVLCAAFMVRTGEDQWRLRLQQVAGDSGEYIQELYNIASKVYEEHVDQWYFLHEEIPFID